MRASILSSVVAVSLASGVGLHPGASWAASTKSGESQTMGRAEPETAEPETSAADDALRSGRVHVDADALGEGGAVLAGNAIKAATDALRAHGVTITDPTEAPAGPELRIRLTKPDPEGFDYVLEYEVLYEGKVVEGSDATAHCDGCNDTVLVEQVAKIAELSLPLLVVPTAESDEGEVDGGNGGDTGGGGSADPEVDDPSKLGGKGKAGVALLVVGGVGIAAGVPLLIRAPKNFPVGPEATKLETTRPMGGIALGVGVGVAVAGAVLLALDIRARKRSGDAPDEAAMAVLPWFDGRVAGAGVRGRF